MTLTGRTGYRVGFTGKIILQVEYSYRYLPAGCRPPAGGVSQLPIRYEWRDATVADVFAGRVAISPAPADDEAAA